MRFLYVRRPLYFLSLHFHCLPPNAFSWLLVLHTLQLFTGYLLPAFTSFALLTVAYLR